MLAMFERHWRRWLIYAIAIPVSAWTAGYIAESLERSRGHNTLTKTLRIAERQLGDIAGPLGRRG